MVLIKQARDRAVRLARMDDHSSLIRLSDTDGRCVYLNMTWLRFTGRRSDEQLGDGWCGAIHPEDRERYLAVYRDSLAAERAFTAEYRLRRHDGVYRRIIDRAVPLLRPAERHRGFFIAGQDVTDQKIAEDAARQAVDPVRRPVAMAQRLIATASHDLLQPLLTADLLVRRLGAGDLAPEQRDAVRRLQVSLNSMREIFTELLDLSIEGAAWMPRPECCPLDDIAARVGMLYEPVAAEKRLRLALYLQPLWAVSNTVMLERVLRNLVDNAVKFTRQGRVLIAVRPVGHEARLQVWDTGPGMAANDLPSIFTAYHRLDDEPAGTGLGLYTVRQMCNRLGHELAVRSVPGRGTVFEIRLPLAEPYL